MPLAANSLLQTPAAAASKAAAANASQPAAEPAKAGAQNFSKVYAKASQDPASAADKVAKPARDKAADAAPKPDVRNDKVGGQAPAVADSGKPLPGGKSKDAAADDQDDTAAKPTDDTASGDPLAVAPPVVPTVPVVEPQPEAVPVQPEVQTPQLAAAAANAAQAVQPQPVADEHFDPQADPLDDLPAVRLAMEQGGHVSASSQTPSKTPPLKPLALWLKPRARPAALPC